MNFLPPSVRNTDSITRTTPLKRVPQSDFKNYRQYVWSPSLQRFLALAVSVVSFWAVSGCSSGSAKPLTNQTPIISVAMWQLPPPNMNVGVSTQVSAVVTNDIANAGIDWVATCTSPDCGTFNPNHTAPGDNTTYTAPPGVPPNAKVSITALSTTDRSKTAS